VIGMVLAERMSAVTSCRSSTGTVSTLTLGSRTHSTTERRSGGQREAGISSRSIHP